MPLVGNALTGDSQRRVGTGDRRDDRATTMPPRTPESKESLVLAFHGQARGTTATHMRGLGIHRIDISHLASGRARSDSHVTFVTIDVFVSSAPIHAQARLAYCHRADDDTCFNMPACPTRCGWTVCLAFRPHIVCHALSGMLSSYGIGTYGDVHHDGSESIRTC